MDLKRQRQLANLAIAETALRDNLHVHSLDQTARAHMERALAHIREAVVASDGGGEARSVELLARQLAGFERFLEFLTTGPGVTTAKNHGWQSGQNGV
jgi:hypothetical protein